jgi:hypothetical protein
MHTNVGTILVLVGTVLFGVALLFGVRGEPRGWYYGVKFLLSLAGLLVGLGVLLGATPLHVV